MYWVWRGWTNRIEMATIHLMNIVSAGEDFYPRRPSTKGVTSFGILVGKSVRELRSFQSSLAQYISIVPPNPAKLTNENTAVQPVSH